MTKKKAPNYRRVENCNICIHQSGTYCETLDCKKHKNASDAGWICGNYETW